MNPTNYFTNGYFFTGTWDDYFVLFVIAAAVFLGILLFRERPKHEPMVHSPPMAWLRAGLYFCAVILFSWTTGVFKAVVQTPLVTTEQLSNPNWLIYLGICCAVTIWGYAYWWPRGTVTHGRKLYVLPSIVYGALWGASGGLFMLTLYSIFEIFQWPSIVNVVLLVAALSVYSMNYQLGWWDQHVSPPHNRRDTNAKKVAFAHQPFLFATLSFFIVYGNMGIYILLNMAALIGSAIAMRFPPFWEADGGPVSLDTATGE